MKLSIIIPVYNEINTIETVFKKVNSLKLPLEREIIIIDDGSSDGTGEIIEQFKQEHVKILKFDKNQGKGTVLRKGFSIAEGDIVMIQDADLEYNPKEIVKLIEPIIKGDASVVYGRRFHKGSKNKGHWVFYLGNRFLSLVTSILFFSKITDMETCYKVMTRNVLESLRLKSSRFDIEPEITSKILKNGFKIFEVPITYEPRSSSEGKKIKWGDGFVALWVLIKVRLGVY